MRLRSLRVLPTCPVVASSPRPGSDVREPLAFASKAGSSSERPPPDSSARVALPGHHWSWVAIASSSSEASTSSSCPPNPVFCGSAQPQIPRPLTVPPAVRRNSGGSDKSSAPSVGLGIQGLGWRPRFLSPDPRSKEDLAILLFVGCQGSAGFFPLPESLLTVTSNVKLFLLI